MKQFLLLLTILVPLFAYSQQESLKTDHAITISKHTLATPDTGTVEFDGTDFRGFDGTNWLILNHKSHWFQRPSTYIGVNYTPKIQGSTIGIHDTGIVNPGGWLYIDNNADTTSANPSAKLPHHIWLKDSKAKDLSILFDKSSGSHFTFGLDSRGYMNFSRSTSFPSLAPGPYYNATTSYLESTPLGIVNMPNQSRSRGSMLFHQAVTPFIWTPVELSNIDYDSQGELTLGPPLSVVYPGVVPATETAFFTATTEGYYQVNARIEFRLDSVYENGLPAYVMPVGTPNSMVTIAIFKGNVTMPGGSVIIAQGNSLEICDGAGVFVLEGATPNVSDVVYLDEGDTISLWVKHTNITNPLTIWPFFRAINAAPGPHEPAVSVPTSVKCYMSVHKSS